MESERKAREVGTLVRVFIYPPNTEGDILVLPRSVVGQFVGWSVSVFVHPHVRTGWSHLCQCWLVSLLVGQSVSKSCGASLLQCYMQFWRFTSMNFMIGAGYA